jgi:hypothetical protein
MLGTASRIRLLGRPDLLAPRIGQRTMSEAFSLMIRATSTTFCAERVRTACATANSPRDCFVRATKASDAP